MTWLEPAVQPAGGWARRAFDPEPPGIVLGESTRKTRLPGTPPDAPAKSRTELVPSDHSKRERIWLKAASQGRPAAGWVSTRMQNPLPAVLAGTWGRASLSTVSLLK